MIVKAKKVFALLISFVLIFSLFSLGAEMSVSAAKSSKEVYKIAEKYTVEVQVAGNGFTATGSGFFISGDGNIVTNYHVIEGATSIVILDNNKKKYTCKKVVAYDANIDLAIIDIDVNGHAYAKISYSYDTGDTIYTLGSAKNLEYTFADGLISTKSRKDESYNKDVSYIQISAPISSGNSGGPLINTNGEVIGVNTWSKTDGQNLNFAVPLSYLKKITHYNYTVSEFAKYSRLAFNTLKNSIINNGTYNSGKNWYRLGYANNDSTLVISFYYYPDSELVSYRYYYEADSIGCAVELYVYADEADRCYLYGYFNGYDDCTGSIVFNPVNYKKNISIDFSYDYSNGIESHLTSLYSSAFSTAMMYWDDCLGEFGLNMGDFGFINYDTPKLTISQKYTLTLNPNGGSVYSGTVYVGKGRTTLLTTPTRAGYKCLGWATSKSAKSAQYKCGTYYKPSNNTTLYAVWGLAAPQFSSLAGTKNGFTVKWNKHPASVSGYQIQYSANSKFTSAKTITVSSYKTVSKSVSKLTNGKVYYVRLRAYKTVSGKKQYTGWSAAKSVVVLPKATSILSLSGVKGGFNVKWKKQTSNITGYQIQYSLSSKFTSAKTVTVSSNKTASKKVTGLKKGKKYFVRVRTYKTLSGKSYYSAWSASKSVKGK